MTHTITFVFAIGICAAFYWWKSKKEQKVVDKEMDGIVSSHKTVEEASQNSEPVTHVSVPVHKMDTKSLFISTLKKLSCQYTENEDGRIYFVFQGENFLADVNPDSCFLRLWDLCWYTSELDNIENFSNIMKSVNKVNYYVSDVKLFYIEYKEDNKVGVVSSSQILFIPDIPAIDNYLYSCLGSFFKAQHSFSGCMQELELQNNNKV